jgi:YggT family protein
MLSSILRGGGAGRGQRGGSCHDNGVALHLANSIRRGEEASTMTALISLIASVIDIYVFIVIANVVLSWLVAFRVINTSNRFVYLIGDFLYRATEPVLGPIRRILPNLGPVDISPIVLILLLMFLKNLVVYDIGRALLS